MSIAEIVQIVLGVLSLIATVLVSFLIYWLQTRHEKEMEKLAKENAVKQLKEEVNKFLIDNEAERDYLPLCIFASNLYRHEKHTREIYTNFCRCNKELQNEILNAAEFNCRVIEGTEWVDIAIDKLKEDIVQYKLGTDYLYDGAKYFHRAFTRYREYKYDYQYKQLFKPIVANRIMKSLTGTELVSISSYIDDYIYFCVEGNSGENVCKNPRPPIDYVWESQGLFTGYESDVCGWMMEIIETIAVIKHNKTIRSDSDDFHSDSTDRQIEFFEDMYYETVRALYYTYYIHNNEGAK